MKILLLADVHANWPALTAIDEKFDICLFVGDLVDYATDPVPCIEWFRGRPTVAVRGNHDHGISECVPTKGKTPLGRLMEATRVVQREQLRGSHMLFLRRLPVTQRVTLDGWTFHLVHATPRDPLGEYLGDDETIWRERLEDVDADFVCVGHTHRPLHFNFGKIQLVNPGSVGQPRDGDPRCSYAVIEDGRVEFRRVKYDVDATLDHMRTCGINGDNLDIAETLLRTGSLAVQSELIPPNGC